MCSIIAKSFKTKTSKNPERGRAIFHDYSFLLSFAAGAFFSYHLVLQKIICPLFLQNFHDSLCCHERDGNADDGCDATSREESVLS